MSYSKNSSKFSHRFERFALYEAPTLNLEYSMSKNQFQSHSQSDAELASFAAGQVIALGTLALVSSFLVAGSITWLYYTLFDSILISKLPAGVVTDISAFLLLAACSLFGIVGSRVVLHRYAKEVLVPTIKDAAVGLAA